MLEQLFNLVKEQSNELVVNNPDIPNEYNEDVMADATETVFSGLQSSAAGGGGAAYPFSLPTGERLRWWFF